jgi:hypothetical protein
VARDAVGGVILPTLEDVKEAYRHRSGKVQSGLPEANGYIYKCTKNPDVE